MVIGKGYIGMRYGRHKIKQKENTHMKKRLFKVVSLIILTSAMCGTSVNATEQYALSDNNYIEMPHDEDAVEVEIFTEEEMLAMCSTPMADISSNAKVYEPDPYEPNNSRATAYPYENTKVITGVHPFNEGYRSAGCHIEGDEDFFSITLAARYTYDVILKNLFDQDRHIYIWAKNDNGTWSRYKYAHQQTGQPEHWHFTATYTGTYYIQIAGGGPEIMYFFFAVEKMGTINTALWPYEL